MSVRFWEPHSACLEVRKGLASATVILVVLLCKLGDHTSPLTVLTGQSLNHRAGRTPWRWDKLRHHKLVAAWTTRPPLPHCPSRSPLECPSADLTSTRCSAHEHTKSSRLRGRFAAGPAVTDVQPGEMEPAPAPAAVDAATPLLGRGTGVVGRSNSRCHLDRRSSASDNSFSHSTFQSCAH